MSRPQQRPKRARAPWWRSASGRTTLIAVAIVGIVVAASVAARSGDSASTTPVVDQEVLDAGGTLYAETCATCHGDDGEGFARSAVPAPPLDGSAHSWHHSDEQIVSLLRTGGTQMPAVASDWPDADVEAVLAYVKNWWAPWQREDQPGGLGE